MMDLGQLDDLAARVLRTGMAPAAAVAVTDRDRTLVSRTYGAASPESLWPIGSIGKSVTAVVALQLAEEGVLDLARARHRLRPVAGAAQPVRADHAAPPADAHRRGDRQLGPRAGVDVRRDRPGRDGAGLRARRAPVLLQRRLPGGRRRAGDVTGRPYGGARAAARARPARPAGRPSRSWCTRRAGACPAAMSRSTTTGPGSAPTASRPARGSSPRRPTAACAAARRTWPPTSARCGRARTCCRPRASPS